MIGFKLFTEVIYRKGRLIHWSRMSSGVAAVKHGKDVLLGKDHSALLDDIKKAKNLSDDELWNRIDSGRIKFGHHDRRTKRTYWE